MSAHRWPWLTLRDLALCFRLLVLVAIAVQVAEMGGRNDGRAGAV